MSRPPISETVELTQAEFDNLLEYSTTLPTGTQIGKRWKRRYPAFPRPDEKSEWFLGEYVPHPDPLSRINSVGISWKKIRITEAA